MKKFSLIVFFFLLLAVNAEAQYATVSSVTVVFKTLDDDKDWNTNVEISLKTAGNYRIAYMSSNNLGGRYPDWSTYSVSVPVVGLYSGPALNGSRLFVGISPTGNDTWRFNLDIIVNYSDGSSISSHGGPYIVTEDSRWIDIGSGF